MARCHAACNAIAAIAFREHTARKAGPRFGYRTGDDGRYVVEEAKAPLVRWIFERYALGWGFHRTVTDLRARDLTEFGPRACRMKWSPQGVAVILRNRTYLGEFHWRPQDDVRDAVVLTGNHPLLVDADTFEPVQRLKGTHRTIRSRWVDDYLLKGLG